MNKRVTIDMPEEMHQLIVEYASEAGDYLRQMIQRHLEDLQDIAAADVAMQSIRKGEPTYPLAELKQRLGLDH